MAERRVIVKEGDKVVYDGPEQRHAQNVALIQPNKMFGMTLETWVKVAGFIVAITIFYIRTDDFMKSQTEINKYMVKFTANSDAYHSAQTGQTFEQGQPNGRFVPTGRSRNSFNVVQPAHAADTRED